jgi:hypothetical protein
MKMDTMGTATQFEHEELKQLLKETKETLLPCAGQDSNGRSFGVVDMWNREKHLRTSSQMRRWLN